MEATESERSGMTDLEDTIRLERVDANLGEIPRLHKVTPVLRAACPGPERRIHGLEGGEGRGLKALRDVNLLQELTSDGEIVKQWFTVS